MIAPTDADWNPDVHADRYGIVEAVPNRLKTKGMMWDTDMELMRGDLVWYDYLMSLNSDSFFVDEVEYKLMQYEYLYVAKRGDDIVCLNGYCLFEPKEDVLKTNSNLIIVHEGKDIRLGKLIYKGNANRSYESEWVDDDSIEVGDMAVFSLPPIMLEAEYHSLFEGNKQYRISQRRYIYGYVRNGGLYPMKDCVIVVPDEKKAFNGNVIIPEHLRKRTDYGTVYKCGDGVIEEGSRVHYHGTSATYIEHEGKEYGLLRMSKILYSK